MLPRPLLSFLVFALPILVVAFAVLMGGYGLAAATGDALGARALWYVAMGCLMATAANLLLLVGALGLEHLARRESPNDPQNRRNPNQP